ncbi:MAG: NAD-binding protein, partial [Salinibacter sp.]
VIVGTVAIYGLTAAPLAQWFGLADPDPNGLLFVGAAPWVRTVAQGVEERGIAVSLIDNNPNHVRHAREEGLDAYQANVLAETILDEIPLHGMGRLLITIPNDEVASLTALHFSDVFDSTDIYQLAAGPESRHGTEGVMPKHLRGRPLFGETTNYESLEEHAERGDEVKLLELTDDFAGDKQQEYYTAEDLSTQYDEHTLTPLFILSGGEDLEVVSEMDQFRLQPEDRILALLGPEPDAYPSADVERSGEAESPPKTETIFEVVSPTGEDGTETVK